MHTFGAGEGGGGQRAVHEKAATTTADACFGSIDRLMSWGGRKEPIDPTLTIGCNRIEGRLPCSSSPPSTKRRYRTPSVFSASQYPPWFVGIHTACVYRSVRYRKKERARGKACSKAVRRRPYLVKLSRHRLARTCCSAAMSLRHKFTGIVPGKRTFRPPPPPPPAACCSGGRVRVLCISGCEWRKRG